MVHSTSGARTTRHLREGPGITFLVLRRTFGLQPSQEWNSYLQNEFIKTGRSILVSAGTSISVSASHWSYDLYFISGDVIQFMQIARLMILTRFPDSSANPDWPGITGKHVFVFDQCIEKVSKFFLISHSIDENGRCPSCYISVKWEKHHDKLRSKDPLWNSYPKHTWSA